MPRKTLTQAFVDRVAPPKTGRVEYWDTVLPGFGLRLTENNARSWTLLFRVEGKLQRVTLPIADYPKVADARARARDIMATAKKGQNIAPLLDSAAGKAAKDTFAAVAENFIDRYAKRTQRRWRETKRILDVYVTPEWGEKSIDDIKRRDVAELLDRIEDRTLETAEGDKLGGPVMADRTLAAVRKLFNWYASRDDEFVSPVVKGMARTKPRERARKRVLTDDELRALWPHLGTAGVFGAFVKSLLLTAQRHDEVAHMRRSEIDSDGVWTIPAERYKTKRANVVPLSPAARALVEAVPIIKVENKASDLVFTLSGVAPFQGVSKAKERLDKASGVTGWTLHDLRRTAKTLMIRSGVRPDISERVLGHVIAGVEGVYDRHEYLDEKRNALERLAATIEKIINPPAGSKVVPLAARGGER